MNSALRYLRYLSERWTGDSLSCERALRYPLLYFRFLLDLRRYRQKPGAEKLRFSDTLPRLHERTPTTPFDAHYFYQDIWAFKRVGASGAEHHVDLGSNAAFAGMLASITKVTFIDIRPLTADLNNLFSVQADILSLPLKDDSIPSLSCLHVAEHIGLGRYGDRLNPQGTYDAARELARVLSRNGDLYFSVPIGKPRLCFNAHRIHSPGRILDYFSELELIGFSAISSDGKFRPGVNVEESEAERYACGLFHFRKA